MTAPTTTTGVDVNFKDPTIIAESTGSGADSGGTPTVGTNQVARWELWDPNRWWTDWRIPPKPQATWERWFDWIGQLRAQVPAIRAAAEDWRTLATQLDDGLQTVQRQRPELATWTGPSGRTMAQALDNLETATRSRADAVRGNPAVLEDLARSIEDAVAPMTALDEEYQQVLTNDAQCRAVALRGAPIMIGVADKLLTAGNALQNSARDEKRAPMAAPVQPLVLQGGAQGPTDQLAQVAGSGGNADPGAVTPGTVVQPPAQPTVAGADQTSGGAVTPAGALARAGLPGVVAAPGGTADPGTVAAGAAVQPGAQPTVSMDHTTAGAASAATGTATSTGRADLPDVMLAGGSAGTAAPAVPAGTAAGWGGSGLAGGAASPFAGGAVAAPAAAGGALPMMTGGAPGAAVASTGVAGAAAVSPGLAPGPAVGGSAGGTADGKRKRERERDEPEVAFLVAPVPVGVGGSARPAIRPGAATGTSGRVGVPGGLLGRTGGPDGTAGPRAVPVARTTRRRRGEDRMDPEDAELLDAEAWRSEPPGPGLVAPRDR